MAGVTLLRHAGCLLLGVGVALAAAVVHRSAFPLGLLLALVTTFAVPSWLLRSRRPRTAASYVAGWLAVFGVLLLGRPEGDFLVAGDVEGYALMAAAFGLLVVGVVAASLQTRPG